LFKIEDTCESTGQKDNVMEFMREYKFRLEPPVQPREMQIVDPIADVILPFVAHYDVPFKYDDAISQLWKQRAFSLSSDLASCPVETLAVYVGAQYCAMVREDVYYRLPEGMLHARRSRLAVDELASRIARSSESESARLQDFYYILVRWRDAFGRLLYRTGNYALARIEFSKALEIIQASKIDFYWCRYDIESNLQRTKFEIAFQVENQKQDAEQIYDSLIDHSEQAIERLETERDWVKCAELRRSIVNCLHNSLRCRDAALKANAEGIAAKRGFKSIHDIQTAESTVAVAQRYADADQYRTAQLLNEQGQLLIRSNPQGALKLYGALSSCDWPRGQFFAKQNTAIINKKAEILLKLCEQIEQDQRENGSFDVMDLDRYDWTLKNAEDLEQDMNEAQKAQLLKHKDAITNAVSRVISIASYRAQFEKKIRKRLRNLASTRVRSYTDRLSDGSKQFVRDRTQYLDQLVNGLEEFAAKEVLEVLRSNRNRKQVTTIGISGFSFLIPVEEAEDIDFNVLKEEGANVSATASPTKSMPNIMMLADSGQDGKKELEELAAKAREADEIHWLDNPLAIQESTGSVSSRAHRLTACEPKALLLRYCITQKSMGDAKTNELIVIWWYRGRSGLVKLPETALQCADFIASPIRDNVDTSFYFHNGNNSRIPQLPVAKQIWEEFMIPVLQDIAKTHAELEIQSLTIVLEVGLYHLPFNLAWVPEGCSYFGTFNTTLAMSCNLSFALNLTSHLLDARRELNQCYRMPDEDELIVLKHSPDFDGPNMFDEVREAVQLWGNRAQIPESANLETVATCLRERAEFLMFACHGERLDSGPVLHLDRCRLVSYNLAYNVALDGNKLLVLGACDSATPDTESYGRFIGAFVSAGAGAILANPCKALILTVCKVPARIFMRLVEADSHPVNFSQELTNATVALYNWLKSEFKDQYSDVDYKLWSSSYQLWL
jgi:CHAT domain